MRITDTGIEVTPDDFFMTLVRGADNRVTVVGPYHGTDGVKRARQDATTWKKLNPSLRTLTCRLMDPGAFEAGMDDPDALYGYSANLKKRQDPFLMDEELVNWVRLFSVSGHFVSPEANADFANQLKNFLNGAN